MMIMDNECFALEKINELISFYENERRKALKESELQRTLAAEREEMKERLLFMKDEIERSRKVDIKMTEKELLKMLLEDSKPIKLGNKNKTGECGMCGMKVKRLYPHKVGKVDFMICTSCKSIMDM